MRVPELPFVRQWGLEFRGDCMGQEGVLKLLKSCGPGRPRMARNEVETRQRILSAALGLFSRLGYHGTTTATIAKRAGVSSGLIFYYFRSKEALFEALIDERSFLPVLRDVVGTPGENTEQLAREVGMRLYAMAQQNSRMIGIVLGEVLKRGPVREHWRRSFQHALESFAVALKQKGFGGEEAVSFAATFVSSVLFQAIFDPEQEAGLVIDRVLSTMPL